MKFIPRNLLPLSLVCLVLVFPAVVIAGDEWRPLDPADLALKAPMVEKDADAEAIFWEVRLNDELEGGTPRTVLRHYVRIKIFSERGRESQSKIDIPFLNNWKIQDIAARTIKPDGTIVELKKEDILERTIEKLSGVKIKAKSFAMPGVEPGAILEYRWKEVRNDRLANYIRLYFQRNVPVQLVKYYIRPLAIPDYSMHVQTFNGSASPFTKEKDNFYSVSMTNVPAFHEEPRMPPEDAVRPWMLLFYTRETDLKGEKFWQEYGKRTYEEYKSRMKVSDEVRTASAAAIAGAATPEEKLEKLFEFCRSKIKNTNDDASGLSIEDRAKLKENKSPADTLKRGMGTGTDIDMLFASMALAAGFDARLVRLSDRSDTFFDKSFPDDYFIQAYDIAVKVGDQWRFYDPASTYVPLGMLRWQEESQQALLSDPKEPIWVTTPLSPPEKSKIKRTARLSLSDDGTLEGDAHIEYYGHVAVYRKEWDDDDSPAQREDTLRETIKKQMSTADISAIKIENITDPLKPFVYNFHIKVPGYAQRTGKRLFLQPEFFQHGIGPLFSGSDRKYPVYFSYPWSEEDAVTIDLPAGFSLDNADAPSPFSAGPISDYKPSIAVTMDGHTLVYKRTFFFGGGNTIVFPVETYAKLKSYFDALHQSDNHTVTLKQSAATASTP
ncbi:MAG TPA: DUF3857 domain-containing protein [Pyrinomonadaceae bacterium]|jgi:hypothetical protein|nr:DUF3857 domain-containing protein [Pyrinomonadaceae bacterium]